MKIKILVLATTLAISGCSSINFGMESFLGSLASCNPGEVRLMQQNRTNMKEIMTDMAKDYILSPAVMGEYQGRSKYRLNNGRLIEAYFYKTGDSSCMGFNENGNVLEPLFFNGQRLVGWGQDYYMTRVYPYIYAPSKERLQSWSMNPRNQGPRKMAPPTTGFTPNLY